jgi:hypothetical protein
MRERRLQILVALKFGSRIDQHVFGKADAAQTSLGALHPADGAFAARCDNYEQVNVAVITRSAPSLRAKEIDFFGLKFLFQAFNSFIQKGRLNGLHSPKITMIETALKARVWFNADDTGFLEFRLFAERLWLYMTKMKLRDYFSEDVLVYRAQPRLRLRD